MHVDSVHQERGIGRTLVAELIDEARGLDWEHVTFVQLVEARN